MLAPLSLLLGIYSNKQRIPCTVPLLRVVAGLVIWKDDWLMRWRPVLNHLKEVDRRVLRAIGQILGERQVFGGRERVAQQGAVHRSHLGGCAHFALLADCPREIRNQRRLQV